MIEVRETVAAPRSSSTSRVGAAALPLPAESAERSLKPVNKEAPAEIPTQHGPKGLRFDFNDGCRVLLPESNHPWRVRLSDLDTGNVLYETEITAGRVNSSKRYYVRFRIEAWQQSELIFRHDHFPADREVLIRFPVQTLGDTIGWFPYAVKFKERHGCRLTCAMNEKLIPLFRDAYPDIAFVDQEQIEPERYYATYTVVLFFQKGLIYDYKDRVPCDFRFVGLHCAAAYILGVDPAEKPPRLSIPDDSRPIPERYVCIGVQSTMRSKYWNNPTGWHEVVDFLKEAGYRVIGIDLKRSHGQGNVWMHLPGGAEDQTGDRPLTERARWLKHAEFFVGLSSGLSWLAWAAGTPVVMISGFTHPRNEFATPYRVINYHTCNSCWNDPLAGFDRQDFFSCPHHKDTPRQFECTRLITAEQVIATIKRIPGFGRGVSRKAPELACEKAASAAAMPAATATIPADVNTPARRPQLDIIIALNNRGLELQSLGRPNEALTTFDNVLAIDPNVAEAYYNRGNVLRELRRFEEALAAYDRALALRPDFVIALNNRGWVLTDLKRYDEALASYDKVLTIEPTHAMTLHNRATLLSDLRRFDEALVSFDALLSLQPDNANVLNNRGVALNFLNRPDEALASYAKALALNPVHIQALGNRGVVLQGMRRFDEALADFEKALAIKPGHPEAHWDMAFFRLLRGDFEIGWQEAEWRWEKKEIVPRKRNFTQPLWLGKEELNGKAILLHAEQGVGDTIHFCRYAPLVARKGGRVILEVQPALVTLLSALKQSTDQLQIVARGERLPHFDYHCPLLSLPLAFGTTSQTIPADIPYLHASEEAIASWKKRLPSSHWLRVGLVWAGHREHANDRNRSIALGRFAPILSLSDVEFVSLQKNASPADIETLGRHGHVLDLGPELRDFADTAAVLSQLDLLVSVDTAAAHLAGAMGKPVHLLLPHMPDWRWLLDRADSPWYPTVRLFRQKIPGQWDDVIRRVAQAVSDLQ
jgi:autotransporter strand-loop-strand O-heptosyltransferase